MIEVIEADKNEGEKIKQSILSMSFDSIEKNHESKLISESESRNMILIYEEDYKQA